MKTRCPYCNQVFEGKGYGGEYAKHVRFELSRARVEDVAESMPSIAERAKAQ